MGFFIGLLLVIMVVLVGNNIVLQRRVKVLENTATDLWQASLSNTKLITDALDREMLRESGAVSR
jgi:hypothetical protein